MAYTRSNIVRVKNTSGFTIPAKSFVKISNFSKLYASGYLHGFEVERPDADNIKAAELLFVAESIDTGDISLAFVDGIFWITQTTGETIAVGDKVGTDTDEFTAIKVADDAYDNNDGQFLVVGIDGDDLLVRARTTDTAIWSYT